MTVLRRAGLASFLGGVAAGGGRKQARCCDTTASGAAHPTGGPITSDPEGAGRASCRWSSDVVGHHEVTASSGGSGTDTPTPVTIGVSQGDRHAGQRFGWVLGIGEAWQWQLAPVFSQLVAGAPGGRSGRRW